MFWAAFRQPQPDQAGILPRTDLVLLLSDKLSRHKDITARIITVLYEAFLPTIIRDGDIFMHDNVSVHKARLMRNLLERIGINIML